MLCMIGLEYARIDNDCSVLLVHRKRVLTHDLKLSEQSAYSREACCPSDVLQKDVYGAQVESEASE